MLDLLRPTCTMNVIDEASLFMYNCFFVCREQVLTIFIREGYLKLALKFVVFWRKRSKKLVYRLMRMLNIALEYGENLCEQYGGLNPVFMELRDHLELPKL